MIPIKWITAPIKTFSLVNNLSTFLTNIEISFKTSTLFLHKDFYIAFTRKSNPLPLFYAAIILTFYSHVLYVILKCSDNKIRQKIINILMLIFITTACLTITDVTIFLSFKGAVTRYYTHLSLLIGFMFVFTYNNLKTKRYIYKSLLCIPSLAIIFYSTVYLHTIHSLGHYNYLKNREVAQNISVDLKNFLGDKNIDKKYNVLFLTSNTKMKYSLKKPKYPPTRAYLQSTYSRPWTMYYLVQRTYDFNYPQNNLNIFYAPDHLKGREVMDYMKKNNIKEYPHKNYIGFYDKNTIYIYY